MKALTLCPPWADMICLPLTGHVPPKRIENRTYRFPDALLGKHIAIHAGKHYDTEGAAWILKEFGIWAPTPSTCLRGIVATVMLSGILSPTERHSDIWYAPGLFGWKFNDVKILEHPIECKGAQGFWNVPEDMEKAIHQERWYKYMGV